MTKSGDWRSHQKFSIPQVSRKSLGEVLQVTRAFSGVSVSVFFLIVVISPLAVAANDPCQKEFSTPNGYVESHATAYSDPANPSAPGILCSLAIAQTTGPQASAFVFQPGGIVHVADLNSSGIHSFAFVSSAPATASVRNNLQTSGSGYQVQGDGLQWDFSRQGYGLQGVRQSSGASAIGASGAASGVSGNCLTDSSSSSTIALTAQTNFDLQSCQNTVVVDLGSSETRQTAALKRDREAVIKGEINGSLKSCRVRVGALFDYQLNKRQVPKHPVIVEPGYNPCVMYASKEFPQLPPNQSLPAFYARHPDHFCRSMQHASLESFPVHSSPIAGGTMPLAGDQDISYHLKVPSQLQHAVADGKGSDCRALARKILGDDGGGSVSGSGAAAKASGSR